MMTKDFNRRDSHGHYARLIESRTGATRTLTWIAHPEGRLRVSDSPEIPDGGDIKNPRPPFGGQTKNPAHTHT